MFATVKSKRQAKRWVTWEFLGGSWVERREGGEGELWEFGAGKCPFV